MKVRSARSGAGLIHHFRCDRALERAFAYLQKAGVDFLSLGELEWTLDLDKLKAAFPELKELGLHGSLPHPAAFEISSRPAPGQAEEPAEPSVDLPKFIS